MHEKAGVGSGPPSIEYLEVHSVVQRSFRVGANGSRSFAQTPLPPALARATIIERCAYPFGSCFSVELKPLQVETDRADLGRQGECLALRDVGYLHDGKATLECLEVGDQVGRDRPCVGNHFA